MLSINTNLSSLIAQRSMKQSTNKLNQAIERMTAGYKLNHSKDNAANYSIATNMTTKLGALQVAEDNVLSGLDLVNTATEVISMMQDRASRLSALSVQARNGTYGAKSLEAINAEAGAITSEIIRLYNSTQYNNVNLFNRNSFTLDENLPKAGESGFIEEPISTFAMRSSTPEPPTAKAEYGGFIENPYTYTTDEINAMTPLTDSITSVTSGEKYSISSVDELVNLQELVNSGVDTTGAIFVLSADIDLSSIANWTPIGTETNNFKGEFDGNGHKIFNLTRNGGNDAQGLFSYVSSGIIKDVALERGSVNGSWESVGALVGISTDSEISNCYTILSVSGVNNVGGIVGKSTGSIINNCYALGNVNSSSPCCGGLIGFIIRTTVNNCYAKGAISSTSYYVGGLIGRTIDSSFVTNCYAEGNTTSTSGNVGGLVGMNVAEISYCYAMGSVLGTSNVGGLVGNSSDSPILNSYATGDVNGTSSYVGGLVGYYRYGDITNCYSTSSIIGLEYTGGLAGYVDAGGIVNSYAKGEVNGTKYVGGLIGRTAYGGIVSSSYSTGNVKGEISVGGLIGDISGTTQKNNFASGNVEGDMHVGGYAGSASLMWNAINSCYSTGDVIGEKFVGGLVGQADRTSYEATYTQCHSYGNVSGSEGVGGLIGGAVLTTNGTSFGKINTVDCQSAQQSVGTVGGVYQYDSATTTYTLVSSYDMSAMLAGIKEYVIKPTSTTLHIGINANDTSSLSFDTNFIFDFTAMNSDVSSDEFYNSINSFVSFLQEKTTILGAVQNRLESALDEISTQYENLVSSRSTLRDADIADISSTYIKQQILQQASATLLSTANQSASIALSLI